jgi:hypothetical protein
MYQFLLKIIQSTYQGPPCKKIGDGAELKAGTTKERPSQKPWYDYGMVWY